uniref:Uncharacterized protein n=1 Tax=Panagrolaimus sp. ES5 TaxID=591445 RepID=A0AC34FCX5_9BILA
MKYFFSSLAPNSKNEMYQILGHCDGYVYLKASHSACQIYRKQIFDVFGWKSMKAFAQLDKDGYSCIYDKGFIQVDGTSGAFKTYASVSFLEHIHHRIQVNAAGNIEFYSLDGYNGIVKGEIEFDDDESTCKETESKQIFYEEFIDFYTLSSRELFFDDVHVFISTPDYFITGYHMVRSLKHIAYMALLPKMKPQELRNLSPFYEFIGFIEKNA